MIISNKFVLSKAISRTWKSTVYIVSVSFLVFNLHEFVLENVFDIPAIIPSILGTALAFFIGFNNSQAYDRWWEARKIWGELVNDSRSWSRQINSFFGKESDASARLIKRHLSFVFALKNNMRDNESDYYLKYLSQNSPKNISFSDNIPSSILSIQNEELNSSYKEGVISDMQYLSLNNLLVKFTDEMGKSERIKNTVYPPPYAFYTRLFIWVFLMTTTYELAAVIGVWSILFGSSVGYIFMTTQNIGLNLLNPFEHTPSGIPLNQISRTIEINLLQSIDEKDIPSKIKSKDYYIM